MFEGEVMFPTSRDFARPRSGAVDGVQRLGGAAVADNGTVQECVLAVGTPSVCGQSREMKECEVRRRGRV